MKKIIILALMAMPLLLSCKEPPEFEEPSRVLAKWALAIKQLNHSLYRSCEAFPKQAAVFAEIYRDFYYDDLTVIESERKDSGEQQKDHEGNLFRSREVSFECYVVSRKTGKRVRKMNGSVSMIKYSEKRSSEGWLMFNRTLTEVNI